MASFDLIQQAIALCGVGSVGHTDEQKRSTTQEALSVDEQIRSTQEALSIRRGAKEEDTGGPQCRENKPSKEHTGGPQR